MFDSYFHTRTDPFRGPQKQFPRKKLAITVSNTTRASATRYLFVCFMISICFGRSSATLRGHPSLHSALSLRSFSKNQSRQRQHNNNRSRIPFSLVKSHFLLSLRGGGGRYSLHSDGSSAFCFTSNRFLTSSSNDPRNHTRRRGRTSNKHPPKPKNKSKLFNSKQFSPKSRNENPFPLFSSFDPSSSSTSDSTSGSCSQNTTTTTTKTSSFFDSVDARMKELKKEQQRLKSDKMSNTKRSIFDMFPLEDKDGTSTYPTLEKKAEEEKQNPMAYNKALFSSYHSIMEEIVKSSRFMKRKDKDEDVKIVVDYLLKDERITDIQLPSLISGSIESEIEESNPSTVRKQFETEIQQQRETFLVKTNFTKVQHQLALRGLTVLGDFCAKRSLSDPLYVAWEKIKEAGMIPKDHSINTYLYVVGVAATSPPLLSTNSSLFPSLMNHASKVENHAVDEDTALDVPSEIATFHDFMYEPTEKSVSLRIKRMVAKGDFVGAEQLLTTPIRQQSKKKKSKPIDESQDSLKLRTFFPILKGYCEQGDCCSALRLFKRMKDSPGVQLESENHILVLSTLAEHGYFKQDSEPIKNAVEKLGYISGSGPHLFDELVQEMANDVLEITSASARRLSNTFGSTHTINNPDIDISCDTTPKKIEHDQDDEEEDFLLKALPSLASMPVNNNQAAKNELVVSRILIDTTTATCPRTKAQLRLIMLEEHQKKEFHDALLRLSAQQFQTFVNSNSKFDPSLNEGDEYAVEQLTKFADWLDNREGEPFTAIIDGANVAYYGQNFEAGKFNYHQIKFLVDALESMNETVLVTVPNKYATKTFYCNNGPQSKKIVLSKAELDILNGLNETGKLYRVPARCLDDYYWMLASVSNQTNSRKGRDLTVAPNQKDEDENETSDQQQWPGTRPMLLSNDKMRDHKLELLAPRLFRRWTSSHLVNYNFTAFVDDECVDSEICFSAPDFFSREIQGNPSGDGEGMAWHFPVSDWSPNERFCVRIPVHRINKK